ncbi:MULTISPECIES: indole-3-glycerol phosphate synthase TrpC [Brevibacillus]|uniref:Indole-3-glycerol phosphate synthase n=1 Tax=Brevibacillus invocatus TaxID=173959 RepID=A0A3M8CIF3_9BACL|nr:MULTISPECIES: indole-3-glycerol phosphate synthase TrpC [Brevibacillus]MCM3077887.1 indole-3-glycerol phosphate synthase TrpC [Brevibacillus invocatus]MCM3428039.1 indole-3-glycerol phosphate synthase TrpC [Brevibacillus invocatus]MDH4616024.1 indole-3-glycerol phosphate synthase TrpC [Brevibacillus sp. AY1]RNB75341.1 indole-3-glycerol phosphate synthase TrpC [Brevibacillus invocatus]
MLHKIVEKKKEEVQQLKGKTSIASLLTEAKDMEKPRGFRQALEQSTRPVSVIAEVKKASPSKGMIRSDFDPLEIASAYQAAQAECISVLTDESFFQGHLSYLQNIHTSVQLPLLRKDFLIDEIQVVEARSAGADCILLIAAILEGEQLRALYQAAEDLGMDVLIEVHDRHESDMVFRYTDPKLLGINNRNLRTFETDLAVTREVIADLPSTLTVVSESGISSIHDIENVKQSGARAVLVGEHFMRQQNVEQAVISLMGQRGNHTSGVSL